MYIIFIFSAKVRKSFSGPWTPLKLCKGKHYICYFQSTAFYSIILFQNGPDGIRLSSINNFLFTAILYSLRFFTIRSTLTYITIALMAVFVCSLNYWDCVIIAWCWGVLQILSFFKLWLLQTFFNNNRLLFFIVFNPSFEEFLLCFKKIISLF